MRAPSPALVMSDAQREILESLAKSQTAAHREVTRAKALCWQPMVLPARLSPMRSGSRRRVWWPGGVASRRSRCPV